MRTPTKLKLEALGKRRVEADFSGGQISSDGGALLLAECDRRLRLTELLAACFSDHRHSDLIEHSVRELLAQRLYGLCLGYEDLNDHERIGRDPLLATLIGKEDPSGSSRRLEKDRGHPLASASTLGRIERTRAEATSASRYAKIVCDFASLEDLSLDLLIESFDRAPEKITLDFDPTDIELHGNQEQKFYHGYYGHYCYLPMYVFCGEQPVMVRLRPSNIDGYKGSIEMLEKIVKRLRTVWPEVQILVRGDSGFCRDDLMAWCEYHGVDYLFGMSKNNRLLKELSKQIERSRREFLLTQKPSRTYRSFKYRTRDSWSRKRRVIGKAEYLAKGENPRFVVTSLPALQYEKRFVYEEIYCARGEMENRIKEEQLGLFADRASAHSFRANDIRVWFSFFAHLLVVNLRRLGLVSTELAKAQTTTLRTKLFKIGAQVTLSVRRVYIQLSSAYPLQELLAEALARLRAPPDFAVAS